MYVGFSSNQVSKTFAHLHCLKLTNSWIQTSFPLLFDPIIVIRTHKIYASSCNSTLFTHDHPNYGIVVNIQSRNRRIWATINSVSQYETSVSSSRGFHVKCCLLPHGKADGYRKQNQKSSNNPKKVFIRHRLTTIGIGLLDLQRLNEARQQRIENEFVQIIHYQRRLIVNSWTGTLCWSVWRHNLAKFDLGNDKITWVIVSVWFPNIHALRIKARCSICS